MTEKNIDILSVNVKVNKQGEATLSMSFETAGREEFDRIVEKIRQIPSVIDVDRNSTG
jgi:GTP pyrophosphokinase